MACDWLLQGRGLLAGWPPHGAASGGHWNVLAAPRPAPPLTHPPACRRCWASSTRSSSSCWGRPAGATWTSWWAAARPSPSKHATLYHSVVRTGWPLAASLVIPSPSARRQVINSAGPSTCVVQPASRHAEHGPVSVPPRLLRRQSWRSWGLRRATGTACPRWPTAPGCWSWSLRPTPTTQVRPEHSMRSAALAPPPLPWKQAPGPAISCLMCSRRPPPHSFEWHERHPAQRSLPAPRRPRGGHLPGGGLPDCQRRGAATLHRLPAGAGPLLSTGVTVKLRQMAHCCPL